MKRSIARRITLVLTALVVLAVCAATLITYLVYVHMQEEMIRNLIQTESNRLVARVSRFGGQWERPFERDMGPSMFAWGESPAVPAPGLPPELRGLPAGLHDLDRGASIWHVAVAPAMDGRLYVVFDSVVVEQQEREFAHALIGIVLGCALLAMLAASAAARWLTTPLESLARRLERWVPGPPGAGAPHADEAERLMHAFNRVQDQVDASIADQREFSANLHHEIRTPLTVIRSDAEVMLLQGSGDPARLRRIAQSVDEIDQSLESTFSLAHASFAEATHAPMRACVDDVLQSLRLEAAKAGLAMVNAVHPAHAETLSLQALMTVMRNIMRNAVLHAAPATLEVESIAHGLRFTDTGPGIAPAELPQVFDRYFTNRRADRLHAAPGEALNQTGLGLAIAKRVCVMQGWSLEVESPVRDGRGTRFTLAFAQGEPASRSMPPPSPGLFSL